jgi:hypothetical protein
MDNFAAWGLWISHIQAYTFKKKKTVAIVNYIGEF